jgi:hypothetical protein
LKLVIVGAAVTVKLLADVPVPEAVVTETFPVVVPAATVAVIWVALLTVNAVALVALNFTAVAPVKFVPVTTTEAPTGPLVGLKLVIVGRAATVKLLADTPVPFAVVTLIGPLVVPVATVAVILVGLLTVNVVALVELNFTAVAPVKFVPVIVATVPTGPAVGLKLVTVGGSVTVKSVADPAVPPPVKTVIFPVLDPLGTVAVIWVALLILKLVDAFALNMTAVAPVKFVPETVTTVPEGPEAGAKLEIVGAAGGGGLLELAAPQAAMTRRRAEATRA